MNHRDRIKNYISDYLENSLDPSTQKEFEDALENSPELRSMTKRILILSNRLSNLKYYHCSDEFTVKLRERIHSSPESFVSRQNSPLLVHCPWLFDCYAALGQRRLTFPRFSERKEERIIDY